MCYFLVLHWSDHRSTFNFGQGTFGIHTSLSTTHICLGMMDRPSTSTNPLFMEQDDDMNSLVIKSNKLCVNSSTILPPTCDFPSYVQGTTPTTSSTITSKRMTQGWTKFALCCSTALLPLRLHQEGLAQVDPPTSPSPAQVHRH